MCLVPPPPSSPESHAPRAYGVMPAVSPTASEDAEYENGNAYMFRAMMITMLVGLITIVVKIQSFAASAARACRRRRPSPFEKRTTGVRGALAASRAAYASR